MEPKNFNALQKINVGNKQRATNAVISPRNLIVLFELVYISRVDIYKAAFGVIYILLFFNSCIVYTY